VEIEADHGGHCQLGYLCSNPLWTRAHLVYLRVGIWSPGPWALTRSSDSPAAVVEPTADGVVDGVSSEGWSTTCWRGDPWRPVEAGGGAPSLLLVMADNRMEHDKAFCSHSTTHTHTLCCHCQVASETIH
jgi:hypothetical protein